MTADYRNLRLSDREKLFRSKHEDCPQGNYAVLWEDPEEPDAPAKVTRPSPAWLGMALHGGILPPVEAYLALAEDEATPGFVQHTRGHLLHNSEPLPAMTEEQAMEYLVKAFIPTRVWRDYRGNRIILRIVPSHLIPTDRIFRGAWRINQEAT